MQIIFPDRRNSCIHLGNVLVIPSSKLRTMHVTNSAVKIGDALKRKGRVGFFPLSAVKVTGWTVRLFYVHDINRSHGTRETHLLIPRHHCFELIFIARQVDVIVLFVKQILDKLLEEFAVLRSANMHQ